MNPLRQAAAVTRGWGDILAGRPRWRDSFVLTPGGLGIAVLIYLVIVLLTLAASALVSGPPGIASAVLTVLVNLLPPFGVLAATLLTYLSLRAERPMLDLLVPAFHALSLVLLLGTAMALLGVAYGPILLGVLGVMLARAARICGGFGIGPSIAYAALSIVVLVVLPGTLYMLMASPVGSN